jgi:hypothetical protein
MRMRTLAGLAGVVLLGASVAPAAASGSADHLPGPLRTPVVAAASLFGPAYDVAAGTEIRSLGLALQSRALMEGDLATVTEDELVAWGWTPSETLDVTVRVEGERFVVRARDVRPGASTLQVSSDHLGVRAVPAGDGIADGDAAPGFRVERGQVPLG